MTDDQRRRDSFLVSVAWLADHIADPNVVVVDASLGDSEAGSRISGAVRFDLDGEMSADGAELPHTLPIAADFTRACRRLGIRRHSLVICYDRQGIYSSARAQWMLTAAGHRRARILNGGLPAWRAAGLPVESWDSEHDRAVTFEEVAADPFVASPFEHDIVTAADVSRILERGPDTVLDARSRGRFAGRDPEPRPGLRSGHMPGAVNLPFTDLLDDGHYLPAESLRAVVEQAAPG